MKITMGFSQDINSSVGDIEFRDNDLGKYAEEAFILGDLQLAPSFTWEDGKLQLLGVAFVPSGLVMTPENRRERINEIIEMKGKK